MNKTAVIICATGEMGKNIYKLILEKIITVKFIC